MARGCATGSCGRKNSLLPDTGMVFLEDAAGELVAQRWHCYLCYVMPLLFAEKPPCGKATPADGEPCALVANHPAWQVCKSRRALDGRAKDADTSTRDGAPKLAAEKVHDTVSRKKNRQGPLYVPSDRRV